MGWSIEYFIDPLSPTGFRTRAVAAAYPRENIMDDLDDAPLTRTEFNVRRLLLIMSPVVLVAMIMVIVGVLS
jgi:hypothetical protein